MLAITQRLFGRRTKTTLPKSSQLLKPSVLDSAAVQEALQKKKEKQKQYFDRHTKELPVLHPGDHVRYGTTNGLKPAVVIQRREEPRSHLIRTSNELVLRRNRKHLYASQESRINQLEDHDLDDEMNDHHPPQEMLHVAEQQQICPAPVQVPGIPLYRTRSRGAVVKPTRYEAR